MKTLNWLAMVFVLVVPACLLFCSQPVVVVSFDASPVPVKQGDNVTLRWVTSGAASVALDHGIGAVPASGSILVAPGQTTTYSIMAANAGSSTVRTVTVTVNPKPVAPPGPPQLETLQAGDTQALLNRIGKTVNVEGDVTYISSWVPSRFRGQGSGLPYTFLFFMQNPWEGASGSSLPGDYCPECWRDYTSYFRAIITPDKISQFVPYLNDNFGALFSVNYPWLVIGVAPGGRLIYAPGPYWNYGYAALQPVRVVIQGVIQGYLSAPAMYLSGTDQVKVVPR